MRYLITILASLILVGCGGAQRHYVSIENFYGDTVRLTQDQRKDDLDRNYNLYQRKGDLDRNYNLFVFKKSLYEVFTTDLNSLEEIRKKTMDQCRKDWAGYKILGFSNLEDGCYDFSLGKISDEQVKKREQFKAALKQEIQKDDVIKAAELKQEQEKIKKSKLTNLELKYSGKCKKFKQGSSEYENCLFDNEKLALEEQKRLATLPAAERFAYTCEKTYGFRKGTDNFKECVFKIMTTEYEMQNQLNQRRIAELERKVVSNQANTAYQNEMLEIERMKAKAMQDQVNFAKNKDITDTLLGISSNLLSNPNRPASNAPQMFNCQTRKLGGFDQIQCF